MNNNNGRKGRKSSTGNKSTANGNIPLNKSPINIDGEFEKALQYHQSGQLHKAEELYNAIISVNPNHSDSLHLLGVIAFQTGKNVQAVNLIKKAIKYNPDNPVYYNNLGNVHRDCDNLKEANLSYQKALDIKPDYAEAHYNLGTLFKDQREWDNAMSSYRKALEIDPGLAEVYNNMGNVLKKQRKSIEAISCFQKAVEVRPNFTEAHNNMGNMLREQGKPDEAIACYQKALETKSNLAVVYNNMGNALKDKGMFTEAIDSFHKSQKIKPGLAESYNNLGNVYQEQGETKEAISCFQKALEIKPDSAEAFSGLFHQLQRVCDWQKREDMTPKLIDFTAKDIEKGIKTKEPPFAYLAREINLPGNYLVSRSWSHYISVIMSTLEIKFSFEGRSTRKSKIVIGYLSNDFQDHPISHLMLSMFGLHNKDEFEIVCYSYGDDDGSYYRERILQDCDKFVDIRNLDHVDSAKRIYEDRVDILVDLKGYTKGGRMEISALRPAPIQIRYLGLAGTTGSRFFDYILTDSIITPKSHAQYYSENFAYLPHCYQINDNTQAISNKDWKKADFGLPEDSFVFCSFNQGYKIGPEMFNTWMNILRQVPEGVLWLQRENEIVEKNLKREAEGRGVKPERLIFTERMPKDQHLGRLKLADMALDTQIVNGAATTSDALWAGVPVITLQGGSFASRMSSSILTALGMSELITQTLEEYESLVVGMACNHDKLKEIRRKISKNRLEGPLFDTPKFVRNLENAYKEMWKVFVAGERPRQIEITEC